MSGDQRHPDELAIRRAQKKADEDDAWAADIKQHYVAILDGIDRCRADGDDTTADRLQAKLDAMFVHFDRVVLGQLNGILARGGTLPNDIAEFRATLEANVAAQSEGA